MRAQHRRVVSPLLVATVAALLQLTALPGAAKPVPAQAAMPGGLRPMEAVGECAGAYEIGDTGLCTHGPDQIPVWVKTRGGPSMVAATQAPSSANAPGVTTAPSVGCDGDGLSGKRVQALYVYVSGRSNRLNDWRPAMRTWATHVDSMFDNSAQETGGHARLRWVTNNCKLAITPIAVSAGAEVNFDTMVSELEARGYSRSDRKYLVWFDSNPAISNACGLGTIASDDRPAADNDNNQQRGYARVDFICWDFAESHELMHTLGGVQLSAPHSSGHWHCTDENDQMCYPDGAGVVMTYPCADPARSNIFDCGHDDYFSTAPGAGSYLAEHWNVARSDWIIGGEVAPDEVPPEPGEPSASFVADQNLSDTALMHIAWEEPDDTSTVAAYELQRRKGSGAWTSVALTSPTATSADLALTVGSIHAFRVRVVDAGGNIGQWVTSSGAALSRLEETSAAVTFSGSFKRRALSGASGGYVSKSGAAGSAATFSFSGSSIAFVSTTASNRGITQVRVDGGEWQQIDLYSPNTTTKRVVWAADVPAGAHTVEIIVTGTSNQAASAQRVDVDAFLFR